MRLPQLFLLTLVGSCLMAIPAVNGWLNAQQGDEPTKQSIILDEITSQELAHFSSRTSTNLTCFIANTVHHAQNDSVARYYGISAVIFKTELFDGDYISLEKYQTGKPYDSSKFSEHTTQFRRNTSYSPTASNLEFTWMKGELCIRLQGEWSRSKADILFTLYYDNGMAQDSNFCPKEMALCKCHSNHKPDNRDRNSEESESHEDNNHSNRYNRCISKHLFCNGISNCGQSCPFDESNKECRGYSEDSESYYKQEACVWTDFDYVLMLVMTGLLFILVPIVLFFILMYHRKFNVSGSGRLMSGVASPTLSNYDGNNNVQHNPHVRHVISTVPANLDHPPAYDDLPDDVKTVGGTQH
ncbi:unnamed protein product [Orchesella dallaii]|uniref:Uncharacterized protein n=1 Tax=Orchesella dallaii TaxID=48710 RepID=A0ABP1REV0_9HEXA